MIWASALNSSVRPSAPCACAAAAGVPGSTGSPPATSVDCQSTLGWFQKGQRNANAGSSVSEARCRDNSFNRQRTHVVSEGCQQINQRWLNSVWSTESELSQCTSGDDGVCGWKYAQNRSTGSGHYRHSTATASTGPGGPGQADVAADGRTAADISRSQCTSTQCTHS